MSGDIKASPSFICHRSLHVVQIGQIIMKFIDSSRRRIGRKIFKYIFLMAEILHVVYGVYHNVLYTHDSENIQSSMNRKHGSGNCKSTCSC